MIRLLLFLITLAHGAVAHAADEELLEPDQAFRLSTRILDERTLEATWKIAPGYYLYRDKFKFESLSNGVRLLDPIIPSGKKKDDPFFGTTEIFTQSVAVRVPFERKDAAVSQARIQITAQGCNEPVGVCYPPLVKEVDHNLPVQAASNMYSAPIVALNSPQSLSRSFLTNNLSNATEPVDPEQAFQVRVRALDKQTLAINFVIADCCYLYRDKTQFALVSAEGAAVPKDLRIGNYELPKGKVKNDEFVGATEVYYEGFDIRLPIIGLRDATNINLALDVTYQGCSEKGIAICYPPTTKRFPVNSVDGALMVTTSTGLGLDTMNTASPPTLKEGVKRFFWPMLVAFGVGLLLTFTPCVLPMIPILSGMIIGQGDKNISKLEGGLMSLSYVLGTAVTYTAVGAVAGATGEQLQAYFQNVWAIGLFSALFVALALSMFGFYELQLPAFIQSHLHRHSTRIHHSTRHSKAGAYAGLFVVGLLSALIVGACVSPLFISALGVAIANRDASLGGAIMFSMALGMGAILIAIGIGAGFLLPKAGPWMDRVKQVFGVLLLAVAIYFLGILPEVPVLFLWAALLIVTSVYLGATQSLPKGANHWHYLWKGIGTFLLIWGVLALLGGFAGQRDIFNPLPFTSFSRATNVTTPNSEDMHLLQSVHTLKELENRLAESRDQGKPALLDFYATWCTDCIRMEQSTFLNPTVRERLNNRFVSLQVDVTDPNDPEVKAIKQRFGVYGPPAMLFFDPRGEERRDLRTYGYRSTEDMLVLLAQVDY